MILNKAKRIKSELENLFKTLFSIESLCECQKTNFEFSEDEILFTFFEFQLSKKNLSSQENEIILLNIIEKTQKEGKTNEH